MSEVMDHGIIGMPFDLAMSSELSRRQFYGWAQAVLVERDGANERAGLLLKAKDEWADRARAAEAELDQARRTAEHWKAEHLAGNAVIDQLRAEVEALRKDLSTASSIANQNADHALRLQVEVERLRNTLNFIRNTRPDHEAMMKWYAAIDAAMAAKEG